MQIWWNEIRYSRRLVARRGPDLFVFVFILLQVLLYSTKYMKPPKFGILVNKTTYLFTSVKSNISRGCAKILEIPEGSVGGGGG